MTLGARMKNAFLYGEPFHVPQPDQVVFKETFSGGEWFRSGPIWNLGKGKVFYFRPGHETYPVFKEELPLRVIENAVRWLAADLTKENKQ
jgi:trehalose utilization protein